MHAHGTTNIDNRHAHATVANTTNHYQIPRADDNMDKNTVTTLLHNHDEHNLPNTDKREHTPNHEEIWRILSHIRILISRRLMSHV